MYDTGHTALLASAQAVFVKGRRTHMKRLIRMINLFEYYELPSHVRPVDL